MVVSVAVCSQRLFRVVGRSFIAFVLAPELPISEWLDELDAWSERSRGFFDSRPVVVDFSHVKLSEPEVSGLLAQLEARSLRIIGVEGVDPAWLGPGLGPLPGGGPAFGAVQSPEPARDEPEETPEPREPEPSALLLNQSVRSGQSVVFPHGDLTITGSVASGAELICGGSIHVYGALRGRAIAGSCGNTEARIFCNSFEAELLAIGGLYKTADDMEPSLRGRAIQAWLDGDVLKTRAQG